MASLGERHAKPCQGTCPMMAHLIPKLAAQSGDSGHEPSLKQYSHPLQTFFRSPPFFPFVSQVMPAGRAERELLLIITSIM